MNFLAWPSVVEFSTRAWVSQAVCSCHCGLTPILDAFLGLASLEWGNREGGKGHITLKRGNGNARGETE